MKSTTSTILSASILLATAAAAPSSGTTYQLTVNSTTPALAGAVVTVKDDSVSSSPNPMGIFSTGEPRVPYTFTFTPNPTNSKLYELTGTLKKTHLIVTGNPAAMGLFDVPIGSNPTVAQNESISTDRWMVWDEADKMRLILAERFAGGDSDLIGAGTWRACKAGSAVDYTLYWYDGLSRLENIVQGCESVRLDVVEAKSASNTPSSSPSASGTSSWLPGATSPGNASHTGASPSPTAAFEGAAPRVAVAGTLVSIALGAMAFML